MKRPLLVALVALAGCNDAAPASLSIKVAVKRDLCAPLAGATVAVLDHAGAVTADAEGNAALTVPASAALLVTAPGFVTTLSSVRSLTSAPPRPLIATAQTLFDAGYTLAGLSPEPTRGTVVVSFVNERDLPIAGVQANLRGGPDPGTRRYVSLGATLGFYAGTDATQPRVGFVTFFNVAPGEYRVDATRPGDSFPPLTVRVLAGAVTFDEVVRAGDAGTEPTPLAGKLIVRPPFPSQANAVAAASMEVTVRDHIEGTRYHVTADANGQFQLGLPFARRPVDLIFHKDIYGPFSRGAECLQPFSNQYDTLVPERFETQGYFLQALGGQAVDPTRGQLLISVRAGSGAPGLDGATVRLDGNPAAPYYASALHGPCRVGACSGGATCPAGSRCEGGQCLAGDAPHCSLEMLPGCPAGFKAIPMNEGPGDAVWRCMPTRTDCFAPSPACPAADFCDIVFSSTTNPPTVAIFAQACMPTPPSAAQTRVAASGSPWPVLFANLLPGDYLVRVEAAGLSFDPMPVHLDANEMVDATAVAR